MGLARERALPKHGRGELRPGAAGLMRDEARSGEGKPGIFSKGKRPSTDGFPEENLTSKRSHVRRASIGTN